jgi:hypothetical protein
MTRIECLGCGHVLRLPPAIPEGGEFACAHCGLQMLNVEVARAFRWRNVDPYVRKRGASRLNLWGGLGGACLWLPILAGVQLSRHQFDALFFLLLAVPYLALIALFATRRARTPGTPWSSWLWIGLGTYGLYLGALLLARPDWAPLLTGVPPLVPSPWELFAMGAVGLVAGAIALALHRRRAARIPRITGTPPEGA